MSVVFHSAPVSTLTAADIEPWRSVPVAVTVDLARNIGQIGPAFRPLNAQGQWAGCSAARCCPLQASGFQGRQPHCVVSRQLGVRQRVSERSRLPAFAVDAIGLALPLCISAEEGYFLIRRL